MNTSELRKMSDAELHQELLAKRREQFMLRMQRGAGQFPRPHQFGKLRKDIARIKTILNERRVRGERP
ncbi:MAG TPA: 50S ribosomal protein L29 [Chromatiales bacterium]|nr:50S ribosomal protein L29 [Chromatiales bacterium]